MTKTLALTLLMAGTLSAAGAASAADATKVDTRARFMAANCAYCHGPEGKSRGAIPDLAGIDKDYFVSQMKAFKTGERPSTVMSKHAQGYTDAEYEALGTWFSTHK